MEATTISKSAWREVRLRIICMERAVDREWRVALTKAGVRHRPGYQLRHTFASICLQSGLQPTWVAKTLGYGTFQLVKSPNNG
jgi:integrase